MGHHFPGVIRVRRRERRRPEGFWVIQDDLFEYRLRVTGTSRSSTRSRFLPESSSLNLSSELHRLV
jgi:hypothetical protein